MCSHLNLLIDGDGSALEMGCIRTTGNANYIRGHCEPHVECGDEALEARNTESENFGW